MNYGSLFAGIGGFDLGLDRAGMSCSWQVEIDQFCRKVLTKHWPDVPKFGDIKNVGKENLTPVDLICGGFPCQPFSVAGKQRGTEDDRHLWPEMLRVITELKPTWVIGENVPGIIPIFLDQAISDLENKGYSCETVVLPAVSFNAPHRRDRLYIIAHHNSKQINKQLRQYRRSSKFRWDTLDTREKAIRQTHQQANNNNVIRLDKIMADTKKIHVQRQQNKQRQGEFRRRSRWEPEPELGRVANGIPDRVDRLKSLGNAVVPQVAEHIGKIILEMNKTEIFDTP